jgi:hypothetical protein
MYLQAVAGTIFSHRSVLRKAWLVWDDDADGVVTVPAFRAGLKSVNILLDTPMTPQQVHICSAHILLEMMRATAGATRHMLVALIPRQMHGSAA